MNEKILIVDDAKFARTVTRKALENGNFTNYKEAATAEEAMELFKEFEPDVTLLDISLPDCKDLTLLEKLLKERKDARIIMCSALGQEGIMTRALKMGAKDFIVKPLEEKQFLQILNKVIRNNS